MHLRDAAAGDRRRVELVEQLLQRPPEGALHRSARVRKAVRRRARVQPRQRRAQVRGEQVRPRGAPLAPLDERLPEKEGLMRKLRRACPASMVLLPVTCKHDSCFPQGY